MGKSTLHLYSVCSAFHPLNNTTLGIMGPFSFHVELVSVRKALLYWIEEKSQLWSLLVVVKGYHALLINYGPYDQITSFPLPPKFSVCSMPLEMASGCYRKAKFLVFKNGLCIISDKNSHSKVLKIGHLAFITAFGCASAVIVSFFQFLEWSWGNMYVYLTSW